MASADASPALLLVVRIVYFVEMLYHHGLVPTVGDLSVDLSSSRRFNLLEFWVVGPSHRYSFFLFLFFCLALLLIACH
jgi:hypothetical protein